MSLSAFAIATVVTAASAKETTDRTISLEEAIVFQAQNSCLDRAAFVAEIRKKTGRKEVNEKVRYIIFEASGTIAWRRSTENCLRIEESRFLPFPTETSQCPNVLSTLSSSLAIFVNLSEGKPATGDDCVERPPPPVPSPPTTPPSPYHPPSIDTQTRPITVGVGTFLGSGSPTNTITTGGTVGLEVGLRPWFSLGTSITEVSPQGDGKRGHEGRFGIRAGNITGCAVLAAQRQQGWLTALSLRGCGEVEVGAILLEGVGFDHNFAAVRPWLALLGRAEMRWMLAPPFGLSVGASVGVPLTRIVLQEEQAGQRDAAGFSIGTSPLWRAAVGGVVEFP